MAEDVFGICGKEIAGAFKVRETVAEGGFAVVYRAYHLGFRAPVALKCLKVPQRFKEKQREEFLRQFQAEAELLFQLSATIPTVVRPLHVDAITLEDGRFVPLMALEWLEGETLHSMLRRRRDEKQGGFEIGELVELTTPIARALEKAHNYKAINGAISIVHRDVKPENIFISEAAGERNLKILDFGIAKVKSVVEQVAGRTSADGGQRVAFTPAYAAPEQWLPKDYGQTGPWTDVWGMALTLVEGMTLCDVLGSDYAAMIGAALNLERRPTPRAEGIEVSDAVEAVFKKALAVHPRHRYRDAGVFWDALEGALQVGEGVRPRSRAHRTAPAVMPRGAPTGHAVARHSRPLSTTVGESPLARGQVVGSSNAAVAQAHEEVPDLETRAPHTDPESGVVELATKRTGQGPPTDALTGARAFPLDDPTNAVQPVAATLGQKNAASAPRTPGTDGPARFDDFDEVEGGVELAAISVPPPMGPAAPRAPGSVGPPGSVAPHRSVAPPGSVVPPGSRSRPGSMSTRHPSVATRTTRAAAPIGRPIPPERQLGRVLKLPVLLILAGIAVSAIHQIVNWATGFTVEVGALRVWMFAGALVGAGILLLMWRLAFANTMRPPSDEI